MAVEIIFQCGDKKYWDEHWKNKNYMSEVFDYILECLQKLLPEFKIANAVIHFDEASPHMHVVGIPVWEGAKSGLSKKVSKRNVFTPQTLSVILQDKLRAEASYGFECYFKEQLAEKKKGRNHDLSVTEYKVAQESRKLADIKQQNNEEQEKNTKLRSNNASISYQIATQEQRHSRNLDVIAADEDRLETVRSSINAAETEYAKYRVLMLKGIEIRDDGNFYKITKAESLSEVERRTRELKNKLSCYGAHQRVLICCREELLVDDYFHAVQEAVKGICDRVREMSGLLTDGNELIQTAFSVKNPYIVLNSLRTTSEQNQQNGLKEIILGLIHMVRNVTAHELRIRWDINENDAIDILQQVSFVHKYMDQ